MRPTTSPRPWRDPLLLTHAGVVAGSIALLVVTVASHDGPDANIGAGLVGLLIALLGAPWSFLYLFGGSGSDAESASPVFVVVSLTAALNVVLHGLVRAWAARRR